MPTIIILLFKFFLGILEEMFQTKLILKWNSTEKSHKFSSGLHIHYEDVNFNDADSRPDFALEIILNIRSAVF